MCQFINFPINKLRRVFILAFFICHSTFVNFSFSQSNRNVWLKQLTDSSFHGRGYVYNGDKIAGDYLEQEFKKLGALPVKKAYRQYYHHNVNTFPDSMRVTVNGKNLIPGVDYIVDPRSGSCFKKFDTIIHLYLANKPTEKEMAIINRNNCLIIWNFYDTTANTHGATVIRMEPVYEYAKSVPVIAIMPNDKLTWSVASENINFPIIQCRYSTFPKDSTTKVSLNIKNEMKYKYQSSNVLGVIKAKKKSKKKKYLVYSAHYDHLGRMGDKTYFPGANDNASGTTMLLCLMEYYKNNPPENFNVLFIAFSGEEAGLLGSEKYVSDPLIPLKKIAFVMNMDIMGTGDDGITVVNATKHEKEFQLLEKINSENNYLAKVKKRGPTSNSDHYWFDKNGVKAFFIYTMGGIQAYHDVYDKYETLPLTKFDEIQKMLIEFASELDYK